MYTLHIVTGVHSMRHVWTLDHGLRTAIIRHPFCIIKGLGSQSYANLGAESKMFISHFSCSIECR